MRTPQFVQDYLKQDLTVSAANKVLHPRSLSNLWERATKNPLASVVRYVSLDDPRTQQTVEAQVVAVACDEGVLLIADEVARDLFYWLDDTLVEQETIDIDNVGSILWFDDEIERVTAAELAWEAGFTGFDEGDFILEVHRPADEYGERTGVGKLYWAHEFDWLWSVEKYLSIFGFAWLERVKDDDD